jgi:hypothetical protein
VKITCLAFMLIAFASLTLRTSCAAPSNQDRASQKSSSLTSDKTLGDHPPDAKHAAPDDGGRTRKDGGTSDQRRDHRHISDRNHSRSPATQTKDRAKQLPNNRAHSRPGNAVSVHQLGSVKSGAEVKAGLVQHETANRAVALRQPSVIRPNLPLVNNARHRGANPAVIGGSENSHGRNSGTINGTAVHRKP